MATSSERLSGIQSGDALTTEVGKHQSAWWRVLLIGFGLYVLATAVLILTLNPNLFPTVVMVGNFLVPVAYVAFWYERRHLSTLSLPSVALAFVYGGVLGGCAAALLEPFFIRKLTFISAFEVGLIEEFAKIIGVVVVARRRRHDSEIDGLILGVAAGMGFAALESTGYAFTAFLSSGGSLSATVLVTLLRGGLAPVGHGTWTAILCSVLFRESRGAHFHFNLRVFGAYLTVVVLHGLWDGMPALMTAMVGPGLDVFIGQAVIGAIGFFILLRRWREAVDRERAERGAATVEGQPNVALA